MVTRQGWNGGNRTGEACYRHLLYHCPSPGCPLILPRQCELPNREPSHFYLLLPLHPYKAVRWSFHASSLPKALISHLWLHSKYSLYSSLVPNAPGTCALKGPIPPEALRPIELHYEPLSLDMWAPGVQHPCLFSLPLPTPHPPVVYHQHLKQSLALTGDWFIHDQDYPRLFLPFLKRNYHWFWHCMVSRKGSQMWTFKKTDLRGRGRRVVPPIYAFIGWFLQCPDQRLNLWPYWYMEWCSNQLGYPPGQNHMWILIVGVLWTDASVSLNFSPHKRIRNITSPINLLGCEG